MSKQTIFENGLIYSGYGNNNSNITSLRDREIITTRTTTLISDNEYRFINPINYLVSEIPSINEKFQIIFNLYVIINDNYDSNTKRVFLRNSALDQDVIYLQFNRIYVVLFDSNDEPVIFRSSVIQVGSATDNLYIFSAFIGGLLPFIIFNVNNKLNVTTLYLPGSNPNKGSSNVNNDINNNSYTTYSELRFKVDTFGSINNTSGSGSDMYMYGLVLNTVGTNTTYTTLYNTFGQEGTSNILYDYSGNNNHLIHVKDILPTSMLITTNSVIDHNNIYGYNNGDSSIENFNRLIDDVLLYKYFSKVQRLTGTVTALQETDTKLRITITPNASNSDIDIYYNYPEALGLSDSQAFSQVFTISFDINGNVLAIIDDIGQLQYRDNTGVEQVIDFDLTPQSYNLTVRPFTSTGGEGILLKIIQHPSNTQDLQGTFYIDNLKINSYTITQDVPILSQSYVPVLPNQTLDILGNTAEYTGRVAFDAYLKEGAAITFTIVTNQYIQFDDLSNAVTVSWDGNGGVLDLDVPNDRIIITDAGTFYNIRVFDSGSNLINHLPVIERTGRKLHDVVGGQIATTTTSINWNTTQNDYFYGEVSGFTISDGSMNYNNLPIGIIVPASSINIGEDFYGNIIPNYGRVGYAIFDDGLNLTKIKLNNFFAPFLNNLGIMNGVDLITYSDLINIETTISVSPDRYVREDSNNKKDFIITSNIKTNENKDLYNNFYAE